MGLMELINMERNNALEILSLTTLVNMDRLFILVINALTNTYVKITKEKRTSDYLKLNTNSAKQRLPTCDLLVLLGVLVVCVLCIFPTA